MQSSERHSLGNDEFQRQISSNDSSRTTAASQGSLSPKSRSVMLRSRTRLGQIAGWALHQRRRRQTAMKILQASERNESHLSCYCERRRKSRMAGGLLNFERRGALPQTSFHAKGDAEVSHTVTRLRRHLPALEQADELALERAVLGLLVEAVLRPQARQDVLRLCARTRSKVRRASVFFLLSRAHEWRGHRGALEK